MDLSVPSFLSWISLLIMFLPPQSIRKPVRSAAMIRREFEIGIIHSGGAGLISTAHFIQGTFWSGARAIWASLSQFSLKYHLPAFIER